ncbi:MAG: ABC transporter permease, partial [Rhodobacteraceae bacterium]|nr:ABC transporter permease [Paracoccaceae bacterium]
MDLSSLNPVAMIVLMIGAATPILLAALGELVVEKSGVLNLGVEGMMIIGAVTGFIAATESGSPYVGMLAAMIGGAMVAAIFAFLTQFLLSNQVATGLALTLFGLGLAALLGGDYNGIKPPATPRLNIEGLSDLPIVGELLFSYDPVIYFSIFLVFCVWYFL